MAIEFKTAPSELAAEYIELRGQTRENPIRKDVLRSYGITAESWAQDIESEKIRGFIALSESRMVGYCFADFETGEVLVLAVRPAYEGQGIGRQLLNLAIELLKSNGFTRLFLGCSPDSAVRSHGFYRRLGWHSTGSFDKHGDEVLELICA